MNLHWLYASVTKSLAAGMSSAGRPRPSKRAPPPRHTGPTVPFNLLVGGGAATVVQPRSSFGRRHQFHDDVSARPSSRSADKRVASATSTSTPSSLRPERLPGPFNMMLRAGDGEVVYRLLCRAQALRQLGQAQAVGHGRG